VDAGTPFTVTATLSSGGNLSLQGVQFHLSAPAGWTVQASGATTSGSTAPGQAPTASWRVLAPAGAQASKSLLTATATLQAAGTTATDTARAQVGVRPLVTMTAQPGTVSIRGGSATPVTLRITNTSGYSTVVGWTADTQGTKIGVSGGTGSLRLGPGASATRRMSLAGSSQSGVLPISLLAQVGSAVLDAPVAYVQVSVASPSLAAAFDNVGITSASDPTVGNYSGTGVTFSAEALAQFGLTPGAKVSHDGITFTWPNVPAGKPDNVLADGQTIAIAGKGTELAFLGASAFGNSSGPGTVTYTDGTTQTFTLTMTDWYVRSPAAQDQILAVTPYRNSPSGVSNHLATVYYTAVPLEAGKTVSTVTLPLIAGAVGSSITAMHIFAMAIGG
jgi:hypothetical protein